MAVSTRRMSGLSTTKYEEVKLSDLKVEDVLKLASPSRILAKSSFSKKIKKHSGKLNAQRTLKLSVNNAQVAEQELFECPVCKKRTFTKA